MSSDQRLLINLPPSFFTHEALQDLFAEASRGREVRRASHNSAEEIEDDLNWANAVIMWSWPEFTDALLDRVGGLDYVGQINASELTARNCLERGIPLSEARHAWSPAVAEFALALILAGLRRVSDFHAEMRSGSEAWVRAFPADIDGRERELSGAAVGLVGFGGIGRRLAELLAPFHTDLRVFDPYVEEDAVAAKGGRKAELDELLDTSEVLVLCAANAKANAGMLNRERIGRIRPGAIVVNVARSMLLDTEALLERARKGDVSFLLDVFDQEPLEADSEFRRLPNVYCSPHRAGGIIPSVKRSIRMLLDDYDAMLAGETRRYAVAESTLVSLP